jgi:N-acetylmuramoyl-L-alanine amidase
MSANINAAPCDRRALAEALTRALVRHAPRGAVRAAEALAAAVMNRRRRAAALWNGAFAAEAPPVEAAFGALPLQPSGTRADAAWNAICRRIALRAAAGAGPDPTHGAQHAVPRDAAPPAGFAAKILAAAIGPFDFYREPA